MFFNKNLIAIDIGSTSIKVVELLGSGQSRTVKNIAIEPLPPSSVVNGMISDVDAVYGCLEKVFKKKKIRTRGRRAAISLGGGAVLLRKISVRPEDLEEDIDDYIFSEAEQALQHDVDDLILRYEKLQQPTHADLESYVLAGAKREMVEQVLDVVRRFNMRTAIVDADTFCLSNLFEHTYGSISGLVAIFNVGSANSQLVILNDGQYAFNRPIQFGGNDYTLALSQGLGVDPGQAEQVKIETSLSPSTCQPEVKGIFEEVGKKAVDEVLNTVSFFLQSGDVSPDITGLEALFLSGGAGGTFLLDRALSKGLDKPVKIFNPFQNIQIDGRKFPLDRIMNNSTLYNVVLGLGLRKAEDA